MARSNYLEPPDDANQGSTGSGSGAGLQADPLVIHCCLTVNSTTLYTYDSPLYTAKFNADFAEIVTKHIGNINTVQETRSDSYPLETLHAILYYKKKLMRNNDLITLMALCSPNASPNFINNLLEQLMYAYLEEYYESGGNSQLSGFQFKLTMKDTITREEQRLWQVNRDYGAADSELSEVRNIMNDNLDRILDRGQQLNSLVDKTQTLNSSAGSFRRRAVAVRRHMRWSHIKAKVLTVLVVALIIYFVIGLGCGLPFYSKCVHPSKPHPRPGDGSAGF